MEASKSPLIAPPAEPASSGRGGRGGRERLEAPLVAHETDAESAGRRGDQAPCSALILARSGLPSSVRGRASTKTTLFGRL